jgi:hypothetical protein
MLDYSKSYFLSVMLVKLSMHVGLLIYATDMVFSGKNVRLVKGLYCRWSRCWWPQHGLKSVMVVHANLGGVALAIHLMAYQDVDATCFLLPHTLFHVVKLAAPGPAYKINATDLVEPPLPCALII